MYINAIRGSLMWRSSFSNVLPWLLYPAIKYSAVYHFSRPCVLTNFAGVEGSSQVQANFVLPEMNKLASEVKSGSLYVLLVSFGMHSYVWLALQNLSAI